ncbi:biotin--[acetyl-CoA-carboxylase] ligase [Anaerolineales bacterium HSG25]|nr:biotin--[acetyl-CoA-carboxylase] ligase [Anaerolineales bacterium HSG25]
MPSTTILSAASIRHNLPTKIFGQNVIHTAQTGSTNSDLKTLAGQNAPEGLLCLTDEQITGRGRLGRQWQAPAQSSVLMSLLFRPTWLKPNQTQRLTMLCALALVEAIEQLTALTVKLKWPNDLVWHDGKKLAGILTEFELNGSDLNWVIVGMGLNVNLDFSTLPASIEPTEQATIESLRQNATSLSMLLGHDTADLRLPLVRQFLINIEQGYQALQTGQLPHQAWIERLIGIGKPTTVTAMDGQQQHGLISGVNADGALLLRQADGTEVTVWAGDVTLRQS